MDLSGLRIVVTGGGSGVGAACAAGFARAGAAVISLDVDAGAGEAVAARIRDGGGACRFLRCDVSSRADIDAAFQSAVDWLGGLDVLAQIAGIGDNTPAADLSEDRLRRLLEVNFLGTVFANQAAARHMTGGGRIINTGSPSGARPMPGFGGYGASKAAMMSWTRTIAAEWGPRGITANVVIPLAITPMALDVMPGNLPMAERLRLITEPLPQVPAGPVRPPETGVVPLMTFLASESASYINGQCINADGGMVMFGS